LHDLEKQRAENRAILERLHQDQSTALIARDADKSIILLTDARGPATNIQGNPASRSSDIFTRYVPLAGLPPGSRIGIVQATGSLST